MASVRSTVFAVAALVALVVYFLGDFPPPPGQLIGAILGIAFWAVEQVLKLVPGEFVSRFFYHNGRSTIAGGVAGGTAYGFASDPLLGGVMAALGFAFMRGNHRAGEHLVPERASR